MKITREVLGETLDFELTSRELYDAFVEQQHKFDICDCQDVVYGLGNEEIVDVYGVSSQEFEKLVDDMAWEMRRNIDKYDMSWDYARDEAIRTVIMREDGWEEVDHEN